MKCKQVCFDLETTSRSPNNAEIVEMAFVTFDYDARTRKDPVIHETFQRFVKPKYNNPDAIKIHGITDAMLQDAAPFHIIQPELEKWLTLHAAPDFVWVGHNVRRYDIPILKRHMSGSPPSLANEVFDTLEVARKVYRDSPRKNLSFLYNMIQTPHSVKEAAIVAHRALDDVRMNIVVACDELRRCRQSAIPTYK